MTATTQKEFAPPDGAKPLNRILVLGGARSGKSRHALGLAARLPGPHVFTATAQAFDDEIQERINRHKQERDDTWQTIEAPLNLADAIAEQRDGTVLVDCCTLWLSNVMLAERDVELEITRLIEGVARTQAHVVLVSNEVGSGIVPESALGRRFRDDQGRLNQRLAQLCDTVELVVAGLPLRIKG